MAKIVLTGGGTAGHVTPNLALVPELIKRGFEISYIGRNEGIEKQLVEEACIPYYSISAGKLRRYADPKNVTDIFRILKGFTQAISLLKRLSPDVVFSKGGFVTAPVVWAARLCKIPVIVHESDLTPGLANKLSIPFADCVCYSFPETGKFLGKKKSFFTGLPIRPELLKGSAEKGRQITGLEGSLPVLLVIGGSQGSKFLNDLTRENLVKLLAKFQICHICGKGNIDPSLKRYKGYVQFEYVTHELPHLYALADVVISRAGATTIFELLALNKPNLLVPLSRNASRGDQILNAESFRKQGFSSVVEEEDMSSEILMETLLDILKKREEIVKNMKQADITNSTIKVADIIERTIKENV